MDINTSKPTMFSKNKHQLLKKYVLGASETQLTDIWYFEVSSALYMQHHYFPYYKVYEVIDSTITEYDSDITEYEP